MKAEVKDETALRVSRRRLLTGAACCALGATLSGLVLHASQRREPAAASNEEFVIVNGWVLLPQDLNA